MSVEYQAATAVNSFHETQALAISITNVHWERIRDFQHLQFSAGGLISGSQFTPFISIGPVWKRQFQNRLFLSLSVSPALLGRSRLLGEPLGGHFHFTSALSIGRRIGSSGSIALRIQHTSNASLRRTNPGLDMIGLSISFGNGIRFSDR
jgi:hypothetical protein